MANARMIWRDFFTSKDLEDLGAKAKVLFAGLFTFADNAGIIRHQPRFFRNTILHGERASLAWIERTLCTFCARSMLEPRTDDARSVLVPCTPEVVKYWKITNFAQFQRLNRREGKRREDDDEGDAPTVAPKPIEEPLLDSEEDPRAEAFAFFERELGAKPKHDAWGAITKLGTTPRDVQEWRKAVAWAKEHSKLDDPVGFVLSKALSFKNPAAAGLMLEPRRSPTDSAHRSSLNERGKFD